MLCKGSIGVALLGLLCLSADGQEANRRTLRPIRAIAGESLGISEVSALDSAAIVTAEPSPPFPIHIDVGETGAMELVVPPSTPAGDYVVEVTRNESVVSIPLIVEPVRASRSVSGRTPVILLNGWQFFCSNKSSTPEASHGTFGGLAELLQAESIPVLFFNNCAYGTVSIKTLGVELDRYIRNLTYEDGSPIEQVDLVAHSMGGLIARAYLAGMQPDWSFHPAEDLRVRKLIQIATPNFGAFASIPVGPQSTEMEPGSAFLWSLATWNQNGDDLRGVDALAIIGNRGTLAMDDGVVTLTSASLGFARDSSRTRILPYCHTDFFLLPCAGRGSIANVDDAPETGQIIRSFLGDTQLWRSMGSTPDQDPHLSQWGGVYMGMITAGAQWVWDLTEVQFGNVNLRGGTGTIFYHDYVRGTGSFLATSASSGGLSCGPVTQAVGYYSTVQCKAGPDIISVGPLREGIEAKLVQSGGLVTIMGEGFGSPCATCRVLLYPSDAQLQISNWTDEAITVALPATTRGFVYLKVETATGVDYVGVMATAATTMTSSVDRSGTGVPAVTSLRRR